MKLCLQLCVGLLLTLLAPLSFAVENTSPRLIETSTDFARILIQENKDLVRPIMNFDGTNSSTTLLMVPQNALALLAERSHQLTHRCGGFIDVTDESSQSLIFEPRTAVAHAKLPALSGAKSGITQAISLVDSQQIEDFVVRYSTQFTTRLANSQQGQQAPLWLVEQWKKMAADLHPAAGITVETVTPPRGYNQASVRITIPGINSNLPIVVMGAHLDSINWSGDAPGADDDASGIGALTEAYRALLLSKVRPQATIQIFGYAAEELGLLGSRAIAETYQNQGIKVRGALQLDMVAHPGQMRRVTFIMDHVDSTLTLWTQQLFGLYIGTDIQEDQCGYACSDHASWTRYGFASVFPFEAMTDQMNQRIHSANDVWDQNLDADFAAQFTKLAVAFAAELSGSY